MGLIDIIKDDFTGGTILDQFPGNGSFNFPGTTAEVICPNSANCNWDYQNGPYAPVLWGTEGARSEEHAPVRYETKMNSFVRTTNSSLAGIVVFPDIGLPQSMYYMAYYANESRIIIDRQYGTGASRLYSSGSVPDPSGTPHLYRVYSNKSDVLSIYVPETNTVLPPNTIGFAFSTDGGSTWTMAHTRTIDIDYFRVGVFCRKWATGGGDNATATFDYFYAEQYDEADYHLDPDLGKVSFEEQIEFPPAGGEGRGPIGEEHGELLGTGAVAAFDEAIEFQPVGGSPRHSALNTEPGVLRAPEAVGFEEQIVLSIDGGPTYMDDKLDGDGQEIIDGLQTRTLVKPDLTADPFNSHGSGWYGAARNGKYYWDGVECSPTGPLGTSFGQVVGGPNRVCWSLWPGVPPLDNNLPSGLTVSIPVDGTVRLAGTGMTSVGSNVCTTLGWRLDGDFDVQLDWSNWSESSGSDGGFYFNMEADRDNRVYVRRRCSGGVAEDGRFDSDVRVNASWGNYAYINASGATSGKFRITRVGNTVHRYYWGGSSWVELGSGINMGRAEPFCVGVETWGNGGLNMSVDLLNVVINSGTVLNQAAWAAEAEATHRGALDECPLYPIAVGTNDTLNLIDTATDKLWMRFIEGSGQTLNPDWTASSEVWVHGLKFREGVLLIAWHGALIHIDFSIADSRIARGITESNRGAWKLNTHGNSYAGWFNDSLTNNTIITRNTNTAWSSPAFDAWGIPHNWVNDCDLWFNGGYEYKVAATAGGLRIFKWRRWYLYGVSEEGISGPDWSDWDTANDVKWVVIDQVTGELFWIDSTNMYSAEKTGAGGWETVMDEGSFPAATTKALPGTRSYSQQYMAIRYRPYHLFMPADEGIYRINWPSGSWELFFGRPGSGATHEVLPEYGDVTTLALGEDGTTFVDLLVVGMIDGVAIVNLADNTLYGRTVAKRNHFTQAVAS